MKPAKEPTQIDCPITRTLYQVPYFELTCSPNHALPHHVFRGTRRPKCQRVIIFMLIRSLVGSCVSSIFVRGPLLIAELFKFHPILSRDVHAPYIIYPKENVNFPIFPDRYIQSLIHLSPEAQIAFHLLYKLYPLPPPTNRNRQQQLRVPLTRDNAAIATKLRFILSITVFFRLEITVDTTSLEPLFSFARCKHHLYCYSGLGALL